MFTVCKSNQCYQEEEKNRRREEEKKRRREVEKQLKQIGQNINHRSTVSMLATKQERTIENRREE